MNVDNVWNDENCQRLAKALAAISDADQMRAFLRDLMTEKEIIEMSARLQAAKMLADGETYSAIVAETKLSSRTVARISSWMKKGAGGYDYALTHHSHLWPARAD